MTQSTPPSKLCQCKYNIEILYLGSKCNRIKTIMVALVAISPLIHSNDHIERHMLCYCVINNLRLAIFLSIIGTTQVNRG